MWPSDTVSINIYAVGRLVISSCVHPVIILIIVPSLIQLTTLQERSKPIERLIDAILLLFNKTGKVTTAIDFCPQLFSNALYNKRLVIKSVM